MVILQYQFPIVLILFTYKSPYHLHDVCKILNILPLLKLFDHAHAINHMEGETKEPCACNMLTQTRPLVKTPFEDAMLELCIAYFVVDLLHYALFVPKEPSLSSTMLPPPLHAVTTWRMVAFLS